MYTMFSRFTRIHNRNKGFTLIELLVVISIIALLSSIILAALNSARITARDSARIQGLVQVRNALELYYTTNGSYPSTGSTMNVYGNSGSNCYSNVSSDQLVPGLMPNFLPSLPYEPQAGNTCLHYTSNGTSYVFELTHDMERALPTSNPFHFAVVGGSCSSIDSNNDNGFIDAAAYTPDIPTDPCKCWFSGYNNHGQIGQYTCP